MVPSVVSAEKFGASSLMRKLMGSLRGVIGARGSDNRHCSVSAFSGFRNHGQSCGIPGRETAGHLDQVRDSVLVENAGGDGRAVTSGAMDGDAAAAGEFVDALLQMVQRNVQAAR